MRLVRILYEFECVCVSAIASCLDVFCVKFLTMCINTASSSLMSVPDSLSSVLHPYTGIVIPHDARGRK